jgi:hypothetical protein
MNSPFRIEPIADEGFYHTIEPRMARRQFDVSLGLVAILSLIALLVGVTAGFSPISEDSAATRQARLVVQTPHHVHVMQAEANLRSGG